MTDNTRLQPGDKVRVKPSSASVLGLPRYRTQTVAHVDDFGQVSIQGTSTYFHPSHFELVRRAVDSAIVGRYGRDADMPCYSLKDGEGDWWVYEHGEGDWWVYEPAEDHREEGAWHMLGNEAATYNGTDHGVARIIADYGIDAEPTSCRECGSYDPNTGLHWDTCPNRGSVHMGSSDAPLAVGDWVKVLARVVKPTPDSDGEIMVATTSRYPVDVYVYASAVTRTDEVPEWAQEPERPEEPTADYAIARDGFRTYVRLPADQVPAFATGKPWALVGTADAYFAWADIEAPTVVVKETN